MDASHSLLCHIPLHALFGACYIECSASSAAPVGWERAASADAHVQLLPISIAHL